MATIIQKIQEFLKERYPATECPALSAQLDEWKHTRPLADVRVLDATPLFANTLVKHLVLLAGGAKLAVGLGNDIPADPKVSELLRQNGIPLLRSDEQTPWELDIVLDCAGVHRHRRPALGVVELTHSGAAYYKNSPLPVLLADDSRCKLVETMLGTGDGFRRAMRELGHGNFRGKRVVLFGCGKVGRGIVLALRAEGALLTVVDDTRHCLPPEGVTLLDLHDRSAIAAAISEAWCVVSVTGVKGAVTQCVSPDIIVQSPALLANMGAEDEFGPDIPESRVLGQKRPLNFLLAEPTQMRYIDPTMALDNLCACAFVTGKIPPGLHPAPAALDAQVLELELAKSVIAPEIRAAALTTSFS